MPKKLEEIKNAILRNPKFSPRTEGESKESAAYAIATNQYKKMQAKRKRSHPRNLDELKEISRKA